MPQMMPLFWTFYFFLFFIFINMFFILLYNFFIFYSMNKIYKSPKTLNMKSIYKW